MAENVFQPQTKSLMTTITETLQLLKLMIFSSPSKTSKIYDLLGQSNNLAESSLYLNLGYWQDQDTYDGACEALARKLAEVGELNPDDDLLDVGCGFGDQDAFWKREFKAKSITAINITDSQLEHARRRFKIPGLEFVKCSATDIKYPDSSFTKVTALESAFHFDRNLFLAEAMRVLKPGGRIAIADCVSCPMPVSLSMRFGLWMTRKLWQVDPKQDDTLDAYKKRFEEAGFRQIEVHSIGDQVFRQFNHYARKRVKDPAVKAKLNPFLRLSWSLPFPDGPMNFDYVIITAVKP